MKILIPEKQYKANMHTHTNISDGCLSPADMKKHYMAHGYSIIAYTDHQIIVPHEDLCDEHFVALHGYEFDVSCGAPCYHINLFCRTQDMRAHVMFHPDRVINGNTRNYLEGVQYIGEPTKPEYSVDFINRLTKAAHEAGFLVQYNHPAWSLQSYPDYAGLEDIDFLEMFNHGNCATSLLEHNDHVMQDMLRMGKFVGLTGSDDNHNRLPFDSPYSDSFGAFTMICAEELTYDSVIRALERKDCYASEGPIIRSLTVQDGVLRGEVTEAALVRVQGHNRFGKTIRPDGGEKSVTTFEVPFEEKWQYLRLIVHGHDGKRAYTRAYRMEEVL